VRGNNTANRLENCSRNRTGINQFCFVNSGYSRHVTGEKSKFVSLVASNGGSVAFGNDKSGTAVGISKIGESLSHSIDCVYLVDGLKHNLLCPNCVIKIDFFCLKQCLVVNINT